MASYRIPQAKTKYGNRHVDADGYTFDSIAEADKYQDLLLLQAGGLISELAVHPCFELIDAYVDPVTRRRERVIYYEADFSFNEVQTDGAKRIVVLDVKGMETKTWRLKRRLFLDRYRWPTYELRVEKVER